MCERMHECVFLIRPFNLDFNLSFKIFGGSTSLAYGFPVKINRFISLR